MALSRNLGTGVVKVQVDFQYLQAQLARVQRMIRSLPTERLKVRIDMGPLRKDLQQIGMSLQRARNWAQKPMQVRVDTSRAKMELRQLRQQLQQLRQGGGGGYAYPTRVPGMGGGGGYRGMGGGATSFFLQSGMFGRAGMAAGGAMNFAGGAASFGAAGALGGMAGAGVLAGGAAAAGTIGFGVKLNADMETYKGSLKVILRDQRKANDLVKELQQIDLDLPVDMAMLAENAQKLAGAGFESTKIGGMIRSIADAAAISPVGTNEGTARIVKAITQIRAKQDLQMEDLNQISELGIPIRQLINEQFGMTAQELGKKTRAGEIDIDTVLDGILEGFDKLFGGALEERSKTFYGSIDQIADRFRAFARDISTPIFKELAEALQGVVEAMKSEDFQKFTKDLTTTITEFVDIIKNASSAVGELISFVNSLPGMNKDEGGPGLGGAILQGLMPGSSSLISAAGGDIGKAMELVPGEGTLGKANYMLGLGNLAFESGAAKSVMKSMAKGVIEGSVGTGERLFGSEKIENPIAMLSGAQMLGAAAKGDYDTAYRYAENLGDTKRMERYRPNVSKELEKEIQKKEAGPLGPVFDMIGGQIKKYGGVSGIRNTVTGSPTKLGQAAGSALLSVGSMLEPLAGIGDKIKEGERKNLGEQLLQNLDFLATENPDIAEALKGTEFKSRLVKNEKGVLVPEFAVGKLGRGDGGMEGPKFADFGNLNKMLQAQVDQARMEEHAKKTAEKAQQLVEEANKQSGFLDEISKKIGNFVPIVQGG